MVDHVILARKLYRLQVPVFIIQWIMSFLSDRTQTTKLGFHFSTQLSINRSIVQGCSIGPILFIMFIHDLKPLDILNYLLNYADDASLLCPENSSTSIELEMAHAIDWARENKITVNLLKTVELVFRRPNISNDLLPSVMSDVRRVGAAKLLGVRYISHRIFLSHST